MRKSRISFYAGVAALTLGSVVFMASCHKKDKTTTTEDTGYASDHMLAEKTYSDVQSMADEAASVSSGNIGYKLTGGPCSMVTHTGDSIIIDFGSTDCMCLDGRTRKGRIIVTYTGGSYATTSSVHTITFDNYFVNDNQVLGTKTVTNMGPNSSGQPYFDVTVNGSIVKASGAGTITIAWSRVRTWTAGYSTPTDYSDDAYAISGSGTITRASGTTVTVDIPTATPLIVVYGCRYIEAGTINYTVPAGLRSVNFGTTPVCNATATVTLPSGATFTVIMP